MPGVLRRGVIGSVEVERVYLVALDELQNLHRSRRRWIQFIQLFFRKQHILVFLVFESLDNLGAFDLAIAGGAELRLADARMANLMELIQADALGPGCGKQPNRDGNQPECEMPLPHRCRHSETSGTRSGHAHEAASSECTRLVERLRRMQGEAMAKMGEGLPFHVAKRHDTRSRSERPVETTERMKTKYENAAGEPSAAQSAERLVCPLCGSCDAELVLTKAVTLPRGNAAIPALALRSMRSGKNRAPARARSSRVLLRRPILGRHPGRRSRLDSPRSAPSHRVPPSLSQFRRYPRRRVRIGIFPARSGPQPLGSLWRRAHAAARIARRRQR